MAASSLSASLARSAIQQSIILRAGYRTASRRLGQSRSQRRRDRGAESELQAGCRTARRQPGMRANGLPELGYQEDLTLSCFLTARLSGLTASRHATFFRLPSDLRVSIFTPGPVGDRLHTGTRSSQISRCTDRERSTIRVLNDASKFPIAAANGFGNVRSNPDLITAKLPALQFYQLAIPAPPRLQEVSIPLRQHAGRSCSDTGEVFDFVTCHRFILRAGLEHAYTRRRSELTIFRRSARPINITEPRR